MKETTITHCNAIRGSHILLILSNNLRSILLFLPTSTWTRPRWVTWNAWGAWPKRTRRDWYNLLTITRHRGSGPSHLPTHPLLRTTTPRSTAASAWTPPSAWPWQTGEGFLSSRTLTLSPHSPRLTRFLEWSQQQQGAGEEAAAPTAEKKSTDLSTKVLSFQDPIPFRGIDCGQHEGFAWLGCNCGRTLHGSSTGLWTWV